MKQSATARILYAALFVSIGFYVIIAHVVAAGGGLEQGGDAENLELMGNIFLGLGFVSTVLSFVIPKVMARAAGGAASEAGAWFTRKVVSWAMSESIVIYGLVYFFMAQAENMQDLYVFAGWSAVIMLVHGPWSPPSSS